MSGTQTCIPSRPPTATMLLRRNGAVYEGPANAHGFNWILRATPAYGALRIEIWPELAPYELIPGLDTEL